MSKKIKRRELSSLYKSFVPKALSFLLNKYRMADADARDLVNQVFVEAFYGPGSQYDSTKAHGSCSWLLTKVDLRAIDFYRARKRRNDLHEKAARIEPVPAPNPEVLYCQGQHEKNQVELFAQLPNDLKRVWKVLRRHRPTQAARILHMDYREIKNAQQRLRRFLKRLTRQLGFQPEDLFGR